MSKYFKDDNLNLENYIDMLYKEHKDTRKFEYALSVLGNISIPKDSFKYFENIDIKESNVNDFIEGIYSIIKRFPMLNDNGIQTLIKLYDKELFIKLDVLNILESIIENNGKNDSCFEKYISEVKRNISIFDMEYIAEARKVSELNGIYSNNFLNYLKSLIIKRHIKYEDILDKLPDRKIIDKDEKRLKLINYIFALNYNIPLSYMVIESLIVTSKTDYFDEELYYVTDERPIKAPFTVSELISTTSMVQEKRKQFRR